jgi:hypothetical protein
LFISQTKITLATTYNYLPPDVLIKQNEMQSSLEYRLQKLEAGASNDSSSMISSLSSRISQLESERETEKNYISGIYARNGIGEQLSGKLAEIDAKYNSQINNLQSQRNELSNSVSNQQSNEKEINDLKLKIAQLKEQIINQELQVNLQAVEKYQVKYEYTDAEVLEAYNYLDALTAQNASNFYHRIRENNPDVAERLDILQNKQYPNGKPGTAKYSDYLESIKKTTKSEDVKKNVKEITKTEIKINPEIKQEINKELVVFTAPSEQQTPIISPIVKEQTFVQKFMSFFGKLFKRNK